MLLFSLWRSWLPPALIAAFLAFALAFLPGRRRSARLARQQRLSGAMLAALAAFYLVTLGAAVFLPLPVFGESRASLTELIRDKAIVLRPFESLHQSWNIASSERARGNMAPMRTFLINQVGNLVLLMPAAGLLWLAAAWRRWVKPQSRRRRSRSILAGLGDRFVIVECIIIFISILIELGQLVINMLSGSRWRIVDINDVLLNATGSLLMLLVCWLLTVIYRLLRRKA
ncbi:MAG: VanZ family protein [Bacillota bacterium]|nr:VanZ family protein [Bacillota bacterium]